MNKNILFYSIHPNDKLSREFINELNKLHLLKKQFILICVNDPKIKIPDKIAKIGKIPVIIPSGVWDKAITGIDVLTWLKNGIFSNSANGMNYGSFDDLDMSQYAELTSEDKVTEYHQYLNKDYNKGFDLKDANINSFYSKLNEDHHVTTYDNSNETKFNKKVIDQKLHTAKKERTIPEIKDDLSLQLNDIKTQFNPILNSNQNYNQNYKLPFKSSFNNNNY